MPKLVDVVSQRRAIAGAAISVINDVGLDGARLRDPVAIALGNLVEMALHHLGAPR